MSIITKGQIIAINTIISKRGLQDQKKSMMLDASGGRTDSTKLLTFEEATLMLQQLNPEQTKVQESADRMVRKLIAMAYDLNWISKKVEVTSKGLQTKKDYSALYDWVNKYGYLRKPLKEYSQDQLPKLLTQFEQGPYLHYLKK